MLKKLFWSRVIASVTLTSFFAGPHFVSNGFPLAKKSDLSQEVHQEIQDETNPDHRDSLEPDFELMPGTSIESIRKASTVTNPVPAPTGSAIRIMRMAIATSATFSSHFFGTATTDAEKKQNVSDYLTFLVGRLNEVFEIELGVRFQLVPNNDNLIFLDPATDGYADNNNSADNDNNQVVTDRVIGSANYDIGHVLTGNNGGNAILGGVGNNRYKANGATGLTSGNLVRDTYFIYELLAHEIGHQFGAHHTFALNTAICDSYNLATAVEPGSGTTIMSYDGTCSEDDVQGFSEPYFHAVSLSQMRRYLATIPNVGTLLPANNSIPSVQVVPQVSSFVIPPRTPFELSATGSDADNDSLRYTWEQADSPSTAAQVAALITEPKLSGPLFRSRLPQSSPVRQFPAMASLLSNATNQETGSCSAITNATSKHMCYTEFLPTTARTMDFRITVRDNRGGISASSVDVVVANSEPFTITSPTTAVSLVSGSTETITWNTAGSEAWATPFPTVDIMSSVDGGKTWNSLADGVANDGSHSVTLPATPTTRARIKIQPEGSIFFDISNTNFTLTSTSAPTVPEPPIDLVGTIGASQATVAWTSPAWDGGSPITSYVVTASPGGQTCSTTSATTCTVTGLTNGVTYSFTATASNSIGQSAASSSVSITPEPLPGLPTSLDPVPRSKSVLLYWSAPASTGGSAIVGYKITRQSVSAGGVVSGTTWTIADSTMAIPYTAQNLTNGTAYVFKVRAIAASGLIGPIATFASVTPFGVPGAPTAVSGVAGDSQVTVSWTAPSANGSAITGYTVNSSSGATCTSTTTSCIVSGLTNGTAYTFTVTATNSAGTGAASTTSASVTPGTDTTTTVAATTTTVASTTPTTAAPTTTLAPTTTAAISSTTVTISTTTIASTTSLVVLTPTTSTSTTTPIKVAAAPLPASPGSLSPTQASKISPSTASTITPSQIKAIRPPTLASLKPTAVAALPVDTVKVITSSQAATLKPSAVVAFSPEQVSALSTKALAALPTKSLAAMKASQAIALTTKQIRVLSPTKIKILNLHKLTSRLSSAQQKEIKRILR